MTSPHADDWDAYQKELDHRAKDHDRQYGYNNGAALGAAALVAVLVCIAFACWGGYVWTTASPLQAESASAGLGQFGDAFGFLNALVSGLAFTALVLTLVQQQLQLRMQQRELFFQRMELFESRKVLVEQADQQRELAQATRLQTASLEQQASAAEPQSIAARLQAAAAESQNSVLQEQLLHAHRVAVLQARAAVAASLTARAQLMQSLGLKVYLKVQQSDDGPLVEMVREMDDLVQQCRSDLRSVELYGRLPESADSP